MVGFWTDKGVVLLAYIYLNSNVHSLNNLLKLLSELRWNGIIE